MLVSTNTHFFEEDYMIDNKPRSKVILDELRAETNEGNEVLILEMHFSGLREILEDPEINPSNYNEAIQDMDTTLW